MFASVRPKARALLWSIEDVWEDGSKRSQKGDDGADVGKGKKLAIIIGLASEDELALEAVPGRGWWVGICHPCGAMEWEGCVNGDQGRYSSFTRGPPAVEETGAGTLMKWEVVEVGIPEVSRGACARATSAWSMVWLPGSCKIKLGSKALKKEATKAKRVLAKYK